jgi:tetratricopeptide (TPR) repeat protein
MIREAIKAVLPWAFLGLLALSALAIGGAHDATKMALAAYTLLLCLAAQFSGRPLRLDHPFIWLNLAALGWAALLVIPLPLEWLATLQPSKLALLESTADRLHVAAPALSPLALDPGATAMESLYRVAILGAFLLGRSLQVTRTRPDPLLSVVVVAGITCLVSLVHSAAGWTRLFGLYEPTMATTQQWLVGPLLNTNHAAALGNLGALVGWGLYRERRNATGIVAAVFAVVCALTVFLSGSRLGILAGVLGAGCLLLWSSSSSARRSPGSRLAVSLGLSAGLILWVSIVMEETAGGLELGLSSISRSAWGVSHNVLSLHPWVGVGPGNLGYASGVLSRDIGAGLTTYAHNTSLQVATDYGLLFLVACAPWVYQWLRDLARTARDHVPAQAAIVGVVVVLVQDQMEFPTYLPGVGLAAAAVLGAVSSLSPVIGERAPRRSVVVFVREHSASIVVGLACVIFSWLAWTGDRPLPRPMDTRFVSPAGTLDHHVERVARLPYDVTFAQTAALRALKEGDTAQAERLAEVTVNAAAGARSSWRTHAMVHLRGPSPQRALPTLWRFARHGEPSLERATGMIIESGHTRLLLPWLSLSSEHLAPLERRLAGRAPRGLDAKLAQWAYERHGPEPVIIDALIRTQAHSAGSAPALKRIATDLLARGGAAEGSGQAQVFLRGGYLAEAYARRIEGDHHVARMLFVAAARADRSRSAEPWLLAAQASFDEGRYAAALQDLKRLKSHASRHRHYVAHGLALEARIAAKRQEMQKAERLLRRATRMLPWDRVLSRRLEELQGARDAAPGAPPPTPSETTPGGVP